jgi:arabinan endo-1,5-alpha-L-arabinosidase
MVARSGNALGPFEHLSDATRGGSNVILENSGFWLAPGHNSVATDDEGTDWILYHAVNPERRHFEDLPRDGTSPRVMLLDRIVYRDGWPRIEGDQPSNTPRDRPAIGRGR